MPRNIIRILYTCRLSLSFSFCRDWELRAYRNNKAIFLLLSKTLYIKYLLFFFLWLSNGNQHIIFIHLFCYENIKVCTIQ